MAVSRDGFVATGPEDPMHWTGPLDKAVFKLLTLCSRDPLAAGHPTASLLPPLAGRSVVPLSRDPSKGVPLLSFARRHPDAWLLGGQTVALEAVREGLLDELCLCHVPVLLLAGVPLCSALTSAFRRHAEVRFRGEPGADEDVNVVIHR